jgi:hypothetical protein
VVDTLLDAFNRGESGQHTAERIRTERSVKAKADEALARYRAAGYQIVTDGVPTGAIIILALAHNGDNLTAELHETCPGRGIVFHSWDPDNPVHFCADPAANGHESRFGTAAADSTAPGGSDEHPVLPLADPQPEPPGGLGMKFVIDGNRAWLSAAKVRLDFLHALFTRNTASREISMFIASQFLDMPGPLRSKLTIAPHRDLFAELTGNLTPDKLDRWTTGKLPMLSLALIVTSYEEQLGGDSGKLTWREDKFSPCGKADAGTYLRFLASLGYELSPIEQAIADGVPYTGDTENALADDASTATETAGSSGTFTDEYVEAVS